MIRTYAASDVLHLPGEIPGLLDGYAGSIEYFATDVSAPVGEWRLTTKSASERGRGTSLPQRLPLSRPEALYRAACWLAEGEACSACLRHKFPKAPACATCHGTGYLRAPAPIWWALPGPSTLPGWVCRAVVHASVLRVAAGMGAIRGVLSRDAETQHWGRFHRTAGPVAIAEGYALLDGDTLHTELTNQAHLPEEGT